MTLLDRLRILLTHTARGLRAQCPTTCAEHHTERRPCAIAQARSSR
ncbi:hypothetical protein ACFWNQ_24955 [Streptomyces virginiae]